MPTFNVKLERCYDVRVESENPEAAKKCVEYFLGNPHDLSSPLEKKKHHFSIGEIEMTWNEALECEQINER